MRFTMNRPGTYFSSSVTSSPRRRNPPPQAAIVVAGGQLNFHARDVVRDRAAFWLILRFLVGKAQLCSHICDSYLAGNPSAESMKPLLWPLCVIGSVLAMFGWIPGDLLGFRSVAWER
jgi:hypothetical protein